MRCAERPQRRQPIEHWLVGLASAPALSGPWQRIPAHSPLPIEAEFIENPIVTPAPNGGWLSVYDGNAADAIGWSWSRRWHRVGEKGTRVVVQPTARDRGRKTSARRWDSWTRRRTLTIFYTGFEQAPDWMRLLRGAGAEERARSALPS